MLVAGLVTLVQLYAIGPIGGKVPIIMGTSSGFLGVMKGVAALRQVSTLPHRQPQRIFLLCDCRCRS